MPSRRFLTSCWTLFIDLLNIYLYKLHQLKGPSAISTPTSAHPHCQQGNTHMWYCVDYKRFLSARVSLSQRVLPCKANFSFLLLYQSSGNRMEKRSPVDALFHVSAARIGLLFSDLLSSLGSLSPSSCFLGESLPKNIYIYSEL